MKEGAKDFRSGQRFDHTADALDAFLADRQKRLLALIAQATGNAAYVGSVEEEGQDMEADEDTVEAELTIGDPKSPEARSTGAYPLPLS